MVKSLKICSTTLILRLGAILLMGILLGGMMIQKEEKSNWSPLYPNSHYLFCDAQMEGSFEVYVPWFHPLNKEIINLFYQDPPRIRFTLMDLRECQFYYETLRYSNTDLLEMDPQREVYKLCAQFAKKIRPKTTRVSFGFLSNISKLFQDKSA